MSEISSTFLPSGGDQVVASGTVYCATKPERTIRVTVISPGVNESELASTITDPDAQKGMDEFRSRSIAYAMEQPAGAAVSEIIVRPTGGY